MMGIFKSYTGNAILNNALMTIEALGKLNNVSEITPELLRSIYEDKDLKALNKRLKSYTMLFSLNNPLVNPAKKKDDMGEKTYNNLLLSILENFENQGKHICEVSGLSFNTTFEDFYKSEIDNQKKEVKAKELEKKEEKKLLNALDKTDTSLNRSWFPLIGGLGSDAQALPQAKFTVQIHPICIPIMQFLPLSALLYKGGVLLIDSSNFTFARDFIESVNVTEVQNRIQTTASDKPVENIRDFAKGNYLLKALEILKRQNRYQNDFTDLNLWSFTNSGTGASCEIERVPNNLIEKLMRLKQNPKISNELNGYLNNREKSYHFLEALEYNKEWYFLYPNVFGSGKKKVEHEGVSESFFEAYFKEIDSAHKFEYAKYLAFLIDKYKTETFAKYLEKRDAHKEKAFHTDLFTVLVKATENGEWSLEHHFEILDNADVVPIKNNFYNILKITHFYFYKKAFSLQAPAKTNINYESSKVCEWLIAFIQNDDRKEAAVKDLLNAQNYLSTRYTNIFYRASQNNSLNLESIFCAMFNEHYQHATYGTNGLLRLFFSQPQQQSFKIERLEMAENWKMDCQIEKWFSEIREFAQDYQAYYFDKYGNKETGSVPYGKFQNLIKAIANENSKFLMWFYEAIENTNAFLKAGESKIADKFSDALLYEPYGEFALTFARFAIKFSLLKQYQKAALENTNS
ncbi:hypothetical protein [Catalinimonas niigatensis]|uniref:hypothetical protein n=1 Tax=Catalinimonas niigatensis TaxID=1397264 RepID=UPI0026651688|nr:hypothetical protein [Catalinimonas niigatensis]WPP51834.1 hypothetical protein PZB72_05465 [Catalinimonas niigatensis]